MSAHLCTAGGSDWMLTSTGQLLSTCVQASTAHRIHCSSISAPRRRRTMLPADVGAKHVSVLVRFDAKRALQTRACNHTNNHNNVRCVCLTVCYYQVLVAAWQHWGPCKCQGEWPIPFGVAPATQKRVECVWRPAFPPTDPLLRCDHPRL